MPGARLYKVGSPYNGEELDDIDIEQTNDIIYIAHIDHPPEKLQRLAHTNWLFSGITFGPTNSPPTSVTATATTPNTDSANSGNAYFPQAASYVVTTVSATTGQESRASTAAGCTNDVTLKRNYNTIAWTAAADVDRYRVYKQENTAGYGWIGDTTDVTFRDDNIDPDLTDSPPVGTNPFTGVGNYPSTVKLFEQRLLWARTKLKPNGVFGSKSADPENMDVSRPLRDSDAGAFALSGERVNAVNQLVALGSKGLLCLSSDGIHVAAGTNGGYLTFVNPVVRKETGRGASRLNPLELDAVIFYQTAVGNQVQTSGYSFEIDGVKTSDVTIFSPHFFRGYDIDWWAYAAIPRSIIWAGRSDGKLLALTWEQDQEVWGWTLCETDGFVVSGTVISEGGEDRLYMVVKRTIDGVDKFYIERMGPVRWGDATVVGDGDVEDSMYLDCSRRYNFDPPQALLQGLEHLEGRTLNALADGSVVTSLTVVDGEVTLPFPASTVIIGIPYVSLIETLPLFLDTQQGGATAGRLQQAGTAYVRLLKSRGVMAGPADDLLYPIQPRLITTPVGEADPVQTGDFEVQMAPDVNTETVIVIEQTKPLPMTVIAVFLDPIIGG